jgi:hypothetical protein
LLENHTVGKFSTPKDLVEKLKGDFKKRFDKSSNEVPDGADEDKFNKSAILLKAFLLTPERYNGYQVKINVSFLSSVFPASRSLCRNFNLTYGLTVGAFARIENPPDPHSKWGFREIYAEGNNIDEFISVVKGKKADVYAQLQFSEEDVNKVQAEFLVKPTTMMDPMGMTIRMKSMSHPKER